MQQKSSTALQRTRDINERLYARNIPSGALQPYLEARPVSTKYSVMSVIDYRRPVSVPLNQDPTYQVSQTFNPGTGFSPWSGFATQVNTESVLRNQVYAIQKCNAATYVPTSKSDLYRVHWKNEGTKNMGSAEHPLLFEKVQLEPESKPKLADRTLFNNSTRVQLNE